MASILKVDTIQDQSGNNIINENADTITIGASGDTITLGSGATPGSGMGKVLQVVSTTKTDTFTMTSTTFTDITGFSISITPSSSSNKILILAEIKHNGNGGERAYLRLLRNSTAICIGDTASNRPRITAGGIQGQSIYTINGESIMFLDSPSTTSATTYKVQMRGLNNSNAIYVNRSRDDRDTADYEPRSASTITVMEISG